MRWDRFFEDIEDQLESEWEAERAALETEAERLRLSRMTLHDRLAAALSSEGEAVRIALELADGSTVTAPLAGIGADWILASPWGSRSGAALIPLAAVSAVGMPHAELLRTARGAVARATAVSRRATFGFAARDLVRRRVGVSVHTLGGRRFDGTIDRAGADHLDLALHDRGDTRRSAAVRGYRIVAFPSIAWIAADSPAASAAR